MIIISIICPVLTTFYFLLNIHLQLLEENKAIRIGFKSELAELQASKDRVIHDLNTQLAENIDKHKKGVYAVIRWTFWDAVWCTVMKCGDIDVMV